jgi:TP901 family phage tail tape measure protein
MAASDMGMGFLFSIRDVASESLKKLRHELDQTRSTGDKAAKSVRDSFGLQELKAKAMAASGGLIDVMMGAARAHGEFGQVMTKVAMISRASAGDVKLLTDAAINAGIATQFTPKDAAEGLKNLASQGFNAKDSMAALLPALDLAAGGSIGVENAAVAMTAAIKVFRLNADQAGEVADKLLHIGHIAHFQANELEIFMGTIGRGAGITKQNLDEMLAAGGLVRNTGVDMSVAASSISAALVHMGQNAKHFKAIGVNVTDAKGEFRPFLDIVQEADTALNKKFPNAAKRVEVAEKLFARFGLTAYSAISGQLGKGIHDAEGHIYKGTEAIKYLRHEMGNAGGTAAKFRDRLLDSFAGAMVLLHGSVETFKVQFGEGFGMVLKPIVQGVTNALNKVLEFMRNLSPAAKKTFATFAAGVTVFLTLTTAGIAFVALLKLLGPALLSSAATLAAVMLPITAVLGVFGIIGAGIYASSKSGTSSIGGLFGNLKKDAGLAFESLSQLFSRGWIDEVTGKKLMANENVGVLNFVKKVWLWGNRLKNFAGGMWEGFTSAIERAAPSFERLSAAFTKFARSLGLTTASTVSENAQAFDEWGKKGARVGDVLATIADVGANVLARTFEELADFVKQARADWPELKKNFSEGTQALKELAGAVKDVTALFSTNGSEAVSWGSLLVGAFTAVTRGFGYITAPIRQFFTGIAYVVKALVAIFTGFSLSWRGLVNGFLQGLLTLVEGSLSVLQVPLRMMGKGAMVEGWKASIAGTKGRLGAWAAGPAVGPEGPNMSIASEEPSEGPMSMPSPLASMPGANAGVSSVETNELLRQLVLQTDPATQPKRPIQIILDRQKVGEGMASNERDEGFASFSPDLAFSGG